MLERTSFFPKEKEPVFDGLNIRLHHLVHWSNLVDLYHKRFTKNLWDLSPDELQNAKYRLGKRVEKMTNFFVDKLHIYQDIKDNMHESDFVQNRLRYLNDILGSSQEKNNFVAKNWLTSQVNIVLEIAKNKNVEILLSHDKDGICNSCAVGKHCNTLFPVRDIAYKKILLNMLNESSYWKDKGKYEILKNKDIIVSGQLLFDKQFLSVVENNMLVRYPLLIKTREL